MADLTDEAKAEIAEAIKIVASDKGFSHIKAIRDHLMPPTPENDPPKDGDPKPPPKKESDEKPPAKKAGLWWGDRLDEE